MIEKSSLSELAIGEVESVSSEQPDEKTAADRAPKVVSCHKFALLREDELRLETDDGVCCTLTDRHS